MMLTCDNCDGAATGAKVLVFCGRRCAEAWVRSRPRPIYQATVDAVDPDQEELVKARIGAGISLVRLQDLGPAGWACRLETYDKPALEAFLDEFWGKEHGWAIEEVRG